MSDIFISYASQDRPRAHGLAQALAQQGWSVWWDRTIPSGKRFDQVIPEALAAARCIVVLWSRQSVTSDWVLEEAEEGRKRQILVPIFIEDVLPPMGFRRIQAADLLAWDAKPTAPAFQKLVADIATILGPPPTDEQQEERQRAMQAQLGEKEQQASKAPALHEVDYLVQAEEDLESQGASPEVVALLKNSIAVGLFLRDVVTRGEHGKAYKTLVAKEEYRATPSAEYLDEQGRKCRNVRTSKRVGSRWTETPDATFVWDKGEWLPLNK